MFCLRARLAANSHPFVAAHLLLPIILLVLIPASVYGQGSGVASTGTGGSHSIRGYVFFPSGRRADGSIQVKLQSYNSGEIKVMADSNGSFSFTSLSPGNYTVVVDAGENYEIARESVVIESDINPSRSSGAITNTSRPYSLMVNLQPKVRDGRSKASVVNVALAEVPEEARRLYEKGVEFASAGDSPKAIDSLRAAISLYPEFPLALNALGVEYLKTGQAHQAVNALNSAVQLSPESFTPKLNLGIALLETSRFPEAEKQLREALQLNSATLTAHMYLGITLVKLHKLQEAELELRRAAEAGGAQLSQSHYYLAGIYWQRREYHRAADELEIYLKLNPNAPDAERVRATIKDLRSRS